MASITKPKRKRRDHVTPTESRKLRMRIYMSQEWQRLRRYYLSTHPLCEVCHANGKTVEAEDVHHIKGITHHPELAFEWSNLMAICKKCHGQIHGHKSSPHFSHNKEKENE